MSNPYLSRGFAPVREERDTERLALEGDWPVDLQGTLYRIGPNPQYEPLPPYNPFLGDGMVHAFRITDDAISYKNRWIRTRQWQLEHEAGQALFATSGDPRLHHPSVRDMVTDGVANTSLYWHAGRLLALEEGHAPIEIDPHTLATAGVWDFAGMLPGNMTAHPKIDPLTGEMIFFANHAGGRFTGEIEWYVAGRQGEITQRHKLRAPFAGLVHDFAVTRDYVIFLVCPLTISIERAMQGGPALAWEPELGTQVAIVDRRMDGASKPTVCWQSCEPCFVWHTLNAWNEGARIHIDLCEQQAPAFPRADGSPSGSAESHQQRLARWSLTATAEGSVARRLLSEQTCEYPRSDEALHMAATRDGYFSCPYPHAELDTDPFHRGLAHFNFDDASMTTYLFGRDTAVSEPVYARGADGKGYVLCVTYEEPRDTSALVLFAARDLRAGPVARALLPFRVPMGFHGCWLDDPAAGVIAQ